MNFQAEVVACVRLAERETVVDVQPWDGRDERGRALRRGLVPLPLLVDALLRGVDLDAAAPDLLSGAVVDGGDVGDELGLVLGGVLGAAADPARVAGGDDLRVAGLAEDAALDRCHALATVLNINIHVKYLFD